MMVPATRREFLTAGGAGLFAAACRPTRLLGIDSEVEPSFPFGAPTAVEIDLASHLLNRCTFGARPGDRESLLSLGAAAWIETQLNPERIEEDTEAERVLRRYPTLQEPAGELYEYKPRVLLRDLVRSTILRAALSRRQLWEVMVEFWSDHFNIDIGKGDCAWLKVADDREVIRAHALGRFADLLRASALSPAMLWYLDGRVNRRARPEERPNENYARELLELHTLGVHGGYTQGDVMEVARCLTGWTVRPRSGFGKGRVEFHAHEHDDGAKTVLGHRIGGGGEGDLYDVLDIVASHPATSRHIATKLCRRFIADEPLETTVAVVAETFTTSGGDIRHTVRTLLMQPEFVSARGTKLKRPFHFLVSALRSTDALTDAPSALSDFLTSMGHAPFQYPTPEGYAVAAAAWERTLIWRWKFAAALAANRVEGTRIDVNGLIRRAGGEQSLMAHVLGRQPSATEQEAWKAMGGGAWGLALLLASPAFQRC
jgi:uncharacterized protein (DUF1800 family)